MATPQQPHDSTQPPYVAAVPPPYYYPIKPKKKKTWISVIVVIVLLAASFVALLEFSYFGLGFWTDVSFENDSGEEIKITPIGIVEGAEKIGPIFSIKKPSLFFSKPEKNTRFHLGVNDSIKITYDWDDQNLQFVIIEYPDEDIRILKLDGEMWENITYKEGGGCNPPDQDNYSIPPRSTLPPCPEILKPTINGEQVQVTDELISILTQL
ncbi:MAG: hypothetical protein KJ886_03455 [Candidatus Thermoplasmatota archaeon]|nr:hypothetical protein [Candidatus Thermoplasmatota archaeon]MCG2827612.1 hypothetical protein [Thermoplasmatales archaeon]